MSFWFKGLRMRARNGLHPEGHRFESCRAHSSPPSPPTWNHALRRRARMSCSLVIPLRPGMSSCCARS
jgi:hypothetical protein